ncbi:MAG: hypothetical protein KatS3mg132_479 [Limisphaera sp.]|nr:MAG: hypothetical protein KatS3mg132_479 [Limisphaera sp.]
MESAAWLVGTPGGGFPIPPAAALEARARPPQRRRLRLEPTEEFASGQVRELQPIRNKGRSANDLWRISMKPSWRMHAPLGPLVLAGLLAGTTPESVSWGPVCCRAAEETSGSWRELFNGRDFTGWRAPTGEWQVVGDVELDPADPRRLRPREGSGVAWNGPNGRTVHLVSVEEFGDAEIHVEFCLARRSNSGVYVMGRYEVQIYDSHGVERDKYPGIECGGIYPRWVNGREVEGHSPKVNASLPAGRWQSFDILFRAPRFDAEGRKIEPARFIRVLQNGQVVHENVVVHGPTRSALFEDEKPVGPLMLQGDHGPVAFRNIRVRPLRLP